MKYYKHDTKKAIALILDNKGAIFMESNNRRVHFAITYFKSDIKIISKKEGFIKTDEAKFNKLGESLYTGFTKTIKILATSFDEK